MRKASCCYGLLFFVFPAVGMAQQNLTGKIVKRGSPEVLTGVTVLNVHQGKHNLSDAGGNYKIPAAVGDTIIFSSAGYRPDTMLVADYMLAESFLVALDPNVMSLKAVKVDELRNYQMDSIKRREDYAFILNKKHPVRLMNEKRAADGPGFSFSPIGYFSKGERRKRKLKKRLAQEEEDYYIDYKFSPARVAQLTGLKGAALQKFLVRYRPSYKWCRNANNQDILLYINEKRKLFGKT